MVDTRSPWQVESDAIDAVLKQPPASGQPTATVPPPAPPNPWHAEAGTIGTTLQQPPSEPFGPPVPPQPNRGFPGYIEDVGANMATGILKGVGYLGGLPNVAGRLYDKASDFYNANLPPAPTTPPSPNEAMFADPMGTGFPPTRPPDYKPGQPGLLTRATSSWDSPEVINKKIFEGIDYARQAIGQPPRGPYEPETVAGRIGQAALSNVIPSLIGSPATLPSRVAAGEAGGAATQTLHEAVPNAPLWADLLTFLAGGKLANVTTSTLNTARRLVSDPYARSFAEQPVAERIAQVAKQPGSDIAATIAQNMPQWTPGTAPDLGNITRDPGIRNLVYQDVTAARKAGDPRYEEMAAQTNEAQRRAIAAARPDTSAQDLQDAIDARDAAVARIPPGATAQEAGDQFRGDMQTVMDRRKAVRSAGGGQFDVLANNPARVDMQPVIDYATEQAAKNAGVVGDAYKSALAQFKSGTGITLDTADFGNSVLSGLGDLAGSLRETPAAARAVNDVKTRLEQSLTSQVPEIGQARATWAENSRPLDIFEQKPFGAALAKDQYGRFYNMPNDQVAESFLRGNGAADALDKLNQVFDSPAQATRGLQDYLAGKVRDNAVAADGTIDAAKLQTTLAPYQRAMMRFPELQRTFSDAKGAQSALDQQQAYQKLYQTAGEGLGTQQLDKAGNQFYSAKAFRDFVNKNSDLIDQAYSPEQAAVVRRVHDELQNMAQTAYAKAPATSGTAQLMPTPKGESSALSGTVMGIIGGHLLGIGGETGALVASGVKSALGRLQGRSGAAFNGVMRNALTDPEYARSLMVRYDPSGLNTPAAEQAMKYVRDRTPWVPVANIAAGQQPSP